MTIYPWIKTFRQQFYGISHDRLTHAYLLQHASGLGVEQVLAGISQDLLCLSPSDGLACGKCKACLLAGHHPDVHRLSPAGSSRSIGIGEVRNVLERAVQATGLSGSRRIVMIEQANRLTQSAANALLVLLEEPPAGVIFLLGYDEGRIIPTIRSRCQHIQFSSPPLEEIECFYRDKFSPEITRNFQSTSLYPYFGGKPDIWCELVEQDQLDAFQVFWDSLNSGRLDTKVSSSLSSAWMLEFCLYQVLSSVRTTEVSPEITSLYRWLVKQADTIQQGISIRSDILFASLAIKWFDVFHRLEERNENAL